MKNPQERPGRGSDQFPLRLPDGMRDYLKQQAAESGRSMNTEIVSRLEQFEQMQRDVYELRLDDIKWLKGEVSRLRRERNLAEALLKGQITAEADDILKGMLPGAVFERVADTAKTSDRSILDEVVRLIVGGFETAAVRTELRAAESERDKLGGSLEAYRGLAELAIESMKQATADGRREVKEYQVMLSQLTLMRSLLQRVVVASGDLPSELCGMLEAVGVGMASIVANDDELSRLAKEAIESIEQLESVEAAQEAVGKTYLSRPERQARLKQLMATVGMDGEDGETSDVSS